MVVCVRVHVLIVLLQWIVIVAPINQHFVYVVPLCACCVDMVCVASVVVHFVSDTVVFDVLPMFYLL